MHGCIKLKKLLQVFFSPRLVPGDHGNSDICTKTFYSRSVPGDHCNSEIEKTSAHDFTHLMLYGALPSSTPSPEREPSKSAARPPSMSSDLMFVNQLANICDIFRLKLECTFKLCRCLAITCQTKDKQHRTVNTNKLQSIHENHA